MQNQDHNVEDEVTTEEGELIHIKPSMMCGQGEHYFIYESGTKVKCSKCPLGYPISIGTEARDGHIFIHGELIL